MFIRAAQNRYMSAVDMLAAANPSLTVVDNTERQQIINQACNPSFYPISPNTDADILQHTFMGKDRSIANNTEMRNIRQEGGHLKQKPKDVPPPTTPAVPPVTPAAGGGPSGGGGGSSGGGGGPSTAPSTSGSGASSGGLTPMEMDPRTGNLFGTPFDSPSTAFTPMTGSTGANGAASQPSPHSSMHAEGLQNSAAQSSQHHSFQNSLLQTAYADFSHQATEHQFPVTTHQHAGTASGNNTARREAQGTRKSERLSVMHSIQKPHEPRQLFQEIIEYDKNVEDDQRIDHPEDGSMWNDDSYSPTLGPTSYIGAVLSPRIEVNRRNDRTHEPFQGFKVHVNGNYDADEKRDTADIDNHHVADSVNKFATLQPNSQFNVFNKGYIPTKAAAKKKAPAKPVETTRIIRDRNGLKKQDHDTGRWH